MKTHSLELSNCLKKLLYITVNLLLIVVLFLFSACPPSEDEEYGEVELDGIEGTWVLKSATFRQSVDLDGPGNMLPTTDAKTLIYELLGVYNNCSSLDDIPFEFTDEPAKNKDNMGQYGELARSAYAICPQGQGITSWSFDYYLSPNLGDDYYPIIYIFKPDVIDPGELLNWQGGFLLRVTQTDINNEKYTISGHLREESLESSLPDPKPDLTFDFVMERIDPE